MTSLLVVGVNGTVASTAALDWSIAWATDHAMTLSVCTVLSDELFDSPDGAALRHHREFLKMAYQRVRRVSPALHLSIQLLRGDTATVLGALSKDAALLVVGSGGPRYTNEHAHVTLAMTLAGHTRIPLVVVGESRSPNPGRIVVGTDDDGDTEPMRFAAEVASKEKRILLIVHAIEHRVRRTPTDADGRTIDAARQSQADAVSERCELIRKAYSGLVVTGRVEDGNASIAMVENAVGASLVVVGSRRRPGVSEFGIGPVGRDLIRTLPCPVVIVPPVRMTPASPLTSLTPLSTNASIDPTRAT